MKKIDFNKGWMFSKEGETVKTEIILPHDAMLFEKRAAKNPSSGACSCFEGGIYCYEKNFEAPDEWENQVVQIYFEGSYQNNIVYLNDVEIGACAYGYSSFLVTLNKLNYGKENHLKVVVDNSQMPNTRWYSGSGIYRPVHLLIGEKKHICHQGIKITTKSYKPAIIQVETEHTGGIVKVQIQDGSNVVAFGSGNSVELEIPNAKLWCDETPNLYQCQVSLLDGEETVDKITETFGIRFIEYSNKGLFINGKETLLRGGCVHHDNGILGAKSFAKAEWRRVKLLKEAGYNAIRSSHNPCAEEMAKACDYYGVFIMDESWDMWFFHKNKYDYAGKFMENYQYDLESMVAKDYNHPSVIMYSIGNEVSEPSTDKGLSMTKELVAYLHKLDKSRPVTGGFNLMIIGRAADGKGIYKEDGGRNEETDQHLPNSSMMFNIMTSMVGTGMNKAANSKKVDAVSTPALDALDIAGYNYATGRYPMEGKCHPDRIIFGSETFPQDIVQNWKMVEKYPYLIGDFMWTSWDYMGEAGAGAWGYTNDALEFEKPYPWILADMGAMDILGDPNGELFQAQAVWHQLDNPKLAVQPVNHPGVTPAKSSWRGTNAIPSWSWYGCEGNKAVVEVYQDADKAELYCNGKKIGTKKIKNCKATFNTKYTPGVLEVITYDASGVELGRDKLASAIEKYQVDILLEEQSTVPDEILYVPIVIVGSNGVVESNMDQTLSVEVEGGELLGFGSANPRTEESFVTGTYKTYYGKSMAVVRVKNADVLCITVDDDIRKCSKQIAIKKK